MINNRDAWHAGFKVLESACSALCPASDFPDIAQLNLFEVGRQFQWHREEPVST
jgi:hypothetical protein